MEYSIEQYEKDWTHPLPNDPKDVWKLRVDLEKVMYKERIEAEKKRKGVRDPHSFLRKNNPTYRAHIRLATRLNLLLRYYGFDGGRRKISAFDFLPGLYKLASTIEELSPEEEYFLDWVEMFVEERTGKKPVGGDLLPDVSHLQPYNEVRSAVLQSFTGKETDLDVFEDTPEFWIAQDEWHTERIKRQRAERKSKPEDPNFDTELDQLNDEYEDAEFDGDE